MSAVAEALGALAAVLEGRGVPWYVFGAQAVAVRGAPRATQDVDVTVKIDREELPALVSALEQAGFEQRFPGESRRLLALAAVVPLVHRSTRMEVDLVLAGSGLEELALSRATRASIGGVVVPVAAATDLAVMKVVAGRGKDLDDLRSLLAGGEVDLAVVRDLLEQLEAALGQSDLVPVLDRAIADVRRQAPARARRTRWRR